MVIKRNIQNFFVYHFNFFSFFMKFFHSSSSSFSVTGKRIIKYPSSVAVSVNDNLVQVSGPLGNLSLQLLRFVKVNFPVIQDTSKKAISVSIQNNEIKKQRENWGTSRTLINNMIQGVQEGVTVPLRLVGVGYRA